VFEDKDLVVFENKTVLPQVFAVPQTGIEVIKGADAQFARLTTPEFKPEQSVILSSPAVAAGVGDNSEEFRSHVATEERNLNGISFEARVNRPAVLVISQPFYPGWHATVDGNETSVLDADLALTAVLIPSGTHHVRLTFYSPSFRVGALLSVLALAGFGASFVGLRRGIWILRIGIGAGVATVVAAGLIISASPRLTTPNGLTKTNAVQITSIDYEKTLQVLESDTDSGYAQFEQSGSHIAGLAVLRHKEKESLGETILRPSVPATSGVFPFLLDDRYRPAVVIVNDNNTPSNFIFSVDVSAPRTAVVPAKHQLALFLDEHPFEVAKSAGTFMWQSDVPVAVAAVQTFHDSSHSFLMAAIPISNSASLVRATIFLPTIGERSEAELVLVNPTQRPLTGQSVWHRQSGERTEEMSYSIPPSMTVRRAVDMGDGWFELIPDRGQPSPDATLFAMMGSGLTRSFIGIRGLSASTEATLELPLLPDTSFKVAVINPNPHVAHVDLAPDKAIPPMSVRMLDGRSVGRRFRTDIPIALIPLRTKYVNGNEYITSSYPAASVVSVFPHFTASGLFSTEFLFFAPEAKDMNGTLRFFGSDGQPANVGWRWHY
jgi:hypothetical protein